MSMNRRDFVKFLALTGAGVSALPEQLAAFERYYEVNTPIASSGLLAIDRIMVSGLATRSIPILLKFFPRERSGGMPFGMNLFGGVVLWNAPGDQKIVIRKPELSWLISAPGYGDELPPFDQVATGHVSYIDQTGLRTNQPILDWATA